MRFALIPMLAAIVFFPVIGNAASYHWINGGNGCSDFYLDEVIPDASGDTIWASDLYAAYLTWDATHMYIAAQFYDNPGGPCGFDVWLGTADGSTVTDASGIGWSKRIGFSGWNPDYVIYTWPSSAGWEVGEIVSNASYTNYGGTFVGHGGWVWTATDSIVIQFPWAAMGSDGFQTGQIVQMAITVTGAWWSACDTAPDQTSGPFGGGANDILDVYYAIPCDGNTDGVPDTGFSFSTLPVEDWELY